MLANNGILFSEEAQKGAQFIQLCNRSDTPLLFVQNITGFMVGTRYEQGGIIKDGAKLINAVSNSTVPHLTLMVGASYGAGNYGMSGRAYDPRFVFTWPNHRIAVMGPKQLAGVMSIVRAGRAAGDPRRGGDVGARLEEQIEGESTALFATGRLWDDGIIDPRDTRTVLGSALSAVHSGPVEGTSSFGVFRHVTDAIADPHAPRRQPGRDRQPRHPRRRGRWACATVAVYSEPDRRAPHVRRRRRRRAAGRSPRPRRYLDIAKLLDAARRAGADACTPATGSCPRTPASPRRASRPD